MKRSFTILGALLAISAGAQTVRVPNHATADDIWGSKFNAGHKITFRGKVTGVEKVRPKGAADSEVTLVVRNSDGGGTTSVDLGPSWYVDHQVAKVKVGDNIQVTGSKVMIDGHGMILASLVRLRGQGGPVLALRRPPGLAYWMGTEVASNATPPEGSNVITGQISQIVPYTYNGIPYQAAVIPVGADGQTFVDLGPNWYYGWQNVNYQVGANVSVVVGPNPITVGPNMIVMPTYSIYSGSNIYTLRNPDGSPVFFGGGY